MLPLTQLRAKVSTSGDHALITSFHSRAPAIAAVNTVGVVDAVGLGATSVVGRAFRHGSELMSGTTTVDVGEPTHLVVELKPTSAVLVRGQWVETWAVTDVSKEPFAYHNNPNIAFEWTVSDGDVVEVQQRAGWVCDVLGKQNGHALISVAANVIDVNGMSDHRTKLLFRIRGF